jgi:hypothetical protein
LESPVSYFSQDIRREGAFGGFGWPAPKAGMMQVDRFLAAAREWPTAIPAAFPRFDDIYRDAGVGDGHPQLPDDSGRTFQSTLRKALDSNARIIQIATWNDWGEGTQIEPSVEFGFRDLEHLQAVRGSQKDRPAAADLRLPLRLLQLRRTVARANDEDALDQIAQLIISGAINAARRRMDETDPKR